jgi:hypothetical protein
MGERRLRSSEAVVGSSELQSARDRSQLSLLGPRLALSHNEPPPANPPLSRHRLSCIIPIILLFCGPPRTPRRSRSRRAAALVKQCRFAEDTGDV